MNRRIVTCPTTGAREKIGYLPDGDGEVLVVLQCTRFCPPEGIACDGACADQPGEPAATGRERRATPARYGSAT